MEGLIKSLAEVAIGFVAEDSNEHSERQSSPVVSTEAQGSSSGYPSRKDEEAEHSREKKKELDLDNDDEKTDDDRGDSHNNNQQPSPSHKIANNRWLIFKIRWKFLKQRWQKFKLPPSDQIYTEIDYDVDTNPSITELSNLSEACNKLWELDLNRLVPGKDYVIQCGGGKKVHQKGDMAPERLFKRLSKDVLMRPTYDRFCSLLDNYIPDVGIEEAVTLEEINEQIAFIEEIVRTPPINYLQKYLVEKGLASANSEQFKDMLTRLWFDLYSRSGDGCLSSSAFEHVFVGEVNSRRKNVVVGFHNWIQFYLEEAKGNLDYRGYILPRGRRVHKKKPDPRSQLQTIQFNWNGNLKPVSTTLIGVSPEFEFAIYTLCFFVGEENNYVKLGPYSVNIKCHRLDDEKISSAYPTTD